MTRTGWTAGWPTCTTASTRERTERRHQPDGGTRPLGVAAIVQKVVAETILTPIYEAGFLGFSYGWPNQRFAVSARQGDTQGKSRMP